MENEITKEADKMDKAIAKLKEMQAALEGISEQLSVMSTFDIQDTFSVSGSIASIGQFVLAIRESKKTITSQLIQMSSNFGKEGQKIEGAFAKIADAMSGNLAKPLKKELESMNTCLSSGLSSLEEKAKSLGDNIAKGVAEGIKSGLRNIKMKTEEVGEGAIKAFQTTFEISSPSKVMKRLGGYIAEGLGIGIKDGTKDVKNAMNQISDTVESSAKKTSKTKFSFGGIAAVATIVGTLAGYFVYLMSSNEELSGKMSEVWAKIQEALSPVIEVVTGLFDAFTQGGEGTTSMLDTIVEVIGGVAEFIILCSCQVLRTEHLARA